MKKIITLILICLMALALMACDSGTAQPSPTAAPSTSQTTAATTGANSQTTVASKATTSQLTTAATSLATSPAQANTTIRIGQTDIVSSLDPTNTSVPWSLTSHGVSEKLYTLDASGNLISRFIDTLQQVDDTHWKAEMKKDVKFSDGSPVTAADVATSMNLIMAKNNFSNATAGKMTFAATGDYSLSIETERTTKLMKSVLCEWTYIIFKDLGNGSYAYTGPYMVKSLEPGVQISLKPNPFYPDASRRSDVIIQVFKDTQAMKLAFESGEIDMAFTVTPDVSDELTNAGYTVKTIDAGYQYFNIVNLKHSPLDDINVRTAISEAINRDDMVKALKGGSVPTGIFAHYYSFAGDSKPVYNLSDAKQLMAKAGWTTNSNGMLEKSGQALKLQLVTYASRPDLSVLMQIAASQLKQLGIDTSTKIVDSIDNTAKQGDYDIIFYAQHTAPTGDPSFFLNQFLRADGGKNFNGYNSADLTALLDKMGTMAQGKDRDAVAVQAQRLIYKDLPLLYLVDPQWHIAVSQKLKNYQPYCGDYYVVNDQLGLS